MYIGLAIALGVFEQHAKNLKKKKKRKLKIA